MTSLDIICIGAINYDYMFHCTAEDLRINEIESGDEKLSNPISEVEDDISELIHKDRPYTTQIGGSAFITLKVIKHILPQLKAAYVGVCGTPNDFDFRYGKSNNLAEELPIWTISSGCLLRKTGLRIRTPEPSRNPLCVYITTREIVLKSLPAPIIRSLDGSRKKRSGRESPSPSTSLRPGGSTIRPCRILSSLK